MMLLDHGRTAASAAPDHCCLLCARLLCSFASCFAPSAATVVRLPGARRPARTMVPTLAGTGRPVIRHHHHNTTPTTHPHQAAPARSARPGSQQYHHRRRQCEAVQAVATDWLYYLASITTCCFLSYCL